FERLEDTMIELQRNLDAKLQKLQSSIETVIEEIPKALGTLKEELPRSIGQSLMSFTDVIGAKIEEIEDAIKRIGGTGGPSADSGSSSIIQNDLSSIKTSILNLQSAFKNIKIETPVAAAPQPTYAPSAAPSYAHTLTPIPATPSYSPPKTSAPASTPPVTLKPTPPPTTPSKVASASGPPMTDVFKLLDSIKEKAKSGITAIQLANEMEQTRDAIVKIFRWHPALYELATFARQLKKYAEGKQLENETRTLLLEKVDEWKNRIST
ncbi:MAG: hypothetical protein LUQ65_04080, partial [Candidatus Helarchaeota archaeon]|nr:hypothetical protein [Candidatus Helarchaeota archaeon]